MVWEKQLYCYPRGSPAVQLPNQREIGKSFIFWLLSGKFLSTWRVPIENQSGRHGVTDGSATRLLSNSGISRTQMLRNWTGLP